MNKEKKNTLNSIIGTTLVLLLMLVSIPINAVTITKGFTGLWHQPEHESQGFDLQIIDQNGKPQALVYWYTYDVTGNPMWLSGLGDIHGNSVSMDLMTVTGVTNLQVTNPNTRNEVILATATFTFDNCSSGNVDVTPSAINNPGQSNSISGTGGFISIERLTSIQSNVCSGGISDNTPADDNDVEYKQFMGNTGVYAGGNARFEFEQDRENSEFEVEVEDIPVGSYSLRVDGIVRSQINVVTKNSGTEGIVEFESPINEGKILLDFDPRNKLIEVLQGSTVLFSSEFIPSASTSTTTTPQSTGAPDYDNEVETKMIMNNTGVIVSARGEVELDQEPNEVEFEVEIEDLPLGNYSLFVDGIEKGIITVIFDDGGNEGEIEFRYPKETGKPLLDFDPRGKLIEVRQNGTTILEVEFTGTANNTPGTGNPVTNGAPPFANNIETKRFLINTGVIGSARGEVELEQELNEVEFEVEIENVPLGNYSLFVGGVDKGIITVYNDDDGTEGEIEFSFPQEFNNPLLDFDPRGQLIEVRQNGTTILQVVF